MFIYFILYIIKNTIKIISLCNKYLNIIKYNYYILFYIFNNLFFIYTLHNMFYILYKTYFTFNNSFLININNKIQV